MLVFKELVNCLSLLINVVMIIMLMKKHLINIFFQKLKLKNTTLKLMEEFCMIKQLMIQLSNTTKSEKYQQEKVMITQLVVILLNQLAKQIYLNKQNFKLSEIIGIENYFHQEINKRKLCSKKINKYVTAFNYIEKILIVLSATGSGVSIISFTIIAGAPVGIASASLTTIFALTT